MINVDGLTKIYARSRKDGAKALDGLSFDVPDQSIFGFLGPNGAGKTTIRILATILEPTVGQAYPLPPGTLLVFCPTCRTPASTDHNSCGRCGTAVRQPPG